MLLCLANVYLPARGSTEDEEGFGECLDMLHEIILKYNSSHTVIIGGDFNSSVHRCSGLRWDRLFMEFVTEHRLNDEMDYPVGDTFFHASNDSLSQTDYFLVAGSPSWSPLIDYYRRNALPQYVPPHPPWAEPEADHTSCLCRSYHRKIKCEISRSDGINAIPVSIKKSCRSLF